jgi:hypothetical protein
MKLSKLIEALQEIDVLAKADPEVDFMFEGLQLELDESILLSTYKWPERGELTIEPEWDEELTIYLVNNGP